MVANPGSQIRSQASKESEEKQSNAPCSGFAGISQEGVLVVPGCVVVVISGVVFVCCVVVELLPQSIGPECDPAVVRSTS